MTLLDRIGIDLGSKIRLEQGIELAARHGVRFIDIQLDNAFGSLDDMLTAREPLVAIARAAGVGVD